MNKETQPGKTSVRLGTPPDVVEETQNAVSGVLDKALEQYEVLEQIHEQRQQRNYERQVEMMERFNKDVERMRGDL